MPPARHPLFKLRLCLTDYGAFFPLCCEVCSFLLDAVFCSSSYLRLINAYRLDPEAALASCSWGKFQIMGGEYRNCELQSAEAVARKMCAGENGQIELLAAFIRRKANWKLWNAVKEKDWARIALYYNGGDYKKNAYDIKMEKAYDKRRVA